MPPVIRPDLLPDQAKAQKISTVLRNRLEMSYRKVSEHFTVWDRLEEQYRAYRPADEEDRDSLEKNGVQKIIVPIQFATVQTMLTFMMEVFTALKPVLRVRGSDPNTMKRARVMEACLDYDYRGNRGFFMLYQWFFNAFRYGYGIMENSWQVQQVLRKQLRQTQGGIIELEGKPFSVPGVMELTTDYFTTFEGNKWQIIDNRNWFPDPRVTLSRFQEGEYCGKRTRIHDNELKKLEYDGIFFNTTKATTRSGGQGGIREANVPGADNNRSRVQMEWFNQEMANAKKAGMSVNEEIYIYLIPKEFELSDEERPELWVFNLINGYTICRAEPTEFIRFPYEVTETYPDILAFMSQGIMELTEPLASHLNFLFNSHTANVRKAINDMFLVDPSRIDLRDLLDPRPGKLVRLLPLAYGTDPSAAVKQLQTVDITRGHAEDSKMLMDLWMRITGASDAMFGQVVASRRTAFELAGVFKMGASRMKLIADLMSAEGVAPLTEQMAILRQENMSMDQFIQIGGWTALDLGVDPRDMVEGWLKVRKSSVEGVFAYPAEEGVLPQDRAKAAEILQKVFDTIASQPYLTQVFDPIGIFKETIRQAGYHNIDEFMNRSITPRAQIMTPEQIKEMLMKGNIQPMDAAAPSGAPVGRPNEGVRESQEGLTLNGLINGSGRTADQRTTG